MMLETALASVLAPGRLLLALDLCGAPGGKSTHLLSLLPEGSFLVANEAIRSRVHILDENLLRWGSASAMVTTHDPERLATAGAVFDLVLVDAPCSGEGLFRKDPGAIAHWSPEAVQLCSARQGRILEAARQLVKPGGHLVYSTCTYEPAENGAQLERLEEHGFHPVAIPALEAFGAQARGHGYQCWPHRVQGEGFFIGVMQRSGAGDDADRPEFRIPAKIKQQSEALQQSLSSWLEGSGEMFFTERNGAIHALPAAVAETALALQATLHPRRSGLPIGTLKGGQLVPHHTLALYPNLKHAFPSLHLDKEDALRYLSRQDLHQQPDSTGWHLVRHGGTGLGWVKALLGRLNNYYPNNWRLRKV